jgi:multidrug efflux pump subunit AcrA (membrane-fusion protein)
MMNSLRTVFNSRLRLPGVFLCAAAITVVSASCANTTQKGENPAMSVRVAQAEIADKPNEVRGFGSLSFLKKNDISSRQDGEIAAIYYREGKEVRVGDILALLKNPRLSIAVEVAEQEFTQAETAYQLAKTRLLEGEFNAEAELLSLKRSEMELSEKTRYHGEQVRKFNQQKTLYTAGGVNEESVRGARFEIDAQAAQLELSALDIEIRKIGLRDKDLAAAGMPVSGDPDEKAKALIALSTSVLRIELKAAETSMEMAYNNLISARTAEAEMRIESPASGFIAVRNYETGEQVKKDDVLFTVLNTDSLYATIPVKESDAALVKKDMPALVKIESTGGEYKAKVDLVSPIADVQSFMFNVRVLIDGKELPEVSWAKPGMFAGVRIILGEPEKTVVIDDTAIINKTKNEGTVFAVQGQNVTMKPVTFGEILENKREIIHGLGKGELVVLKPAAGLKEGAYVQITKK